MKKKQIKTYLKNGILFLGISILLWNCEKSDLTETVNSEVSKSLLTQKSVKLYDIPDVKDFLNLKVKNKFSSKTGALNDAIFDIDNILEVIDTLGNINYTFRFTLPNSSLDTFYNLVVGKTPTGELKTPFVLKYTCDETSLDLYIDNNYNFSFFKGTISLHKYTDFFEQGYFSKTEATNCPPELDQNGDPIPCEIQPIDGSGSSTGEGIDGTGDSTTSGGGSCQYVGVYVMGCGGSNSHRLHALGTCGGDKSIASYFSLWDCAMQKASKTQVDCPPCANLIEGGVGINTISLKSMRTTLKNELILNTAQINWVNNSENDNEVTDIYNFLQTHNIDGIYTSGAISFAESAVDIFSSQLLNSNSNVSNYTTEILRMTNHLKQWGNPEDEFFADYIEGLVPDFSSMTVGDVYDIYELTSTQVRNLTKKYLDSVIIPFAEAAYPFVVYAVTEATLGAAIPLISKIPLSMVLRGARLEKMIKQVGLLGKVGTSNTIRIVTTTNPVAKAESLFATLTKNAISKTTTADGAIVANMGNGNFITFRPLSASQSGFPATISLNFPNIWSSVRDLKFITP
jgi:hypothetical protein